MQKLIPPFLFLFCVLAMFSLDRFYPMQKWLTGPYNLIGVVPLLLGTFMVVSTGKRFRKVKTQIHTFKKPKKLVTNGLFQYSRNPIYLGFTIALLGIAFLLGSLTALIPVLFFFLVANFWYIVISPKIVSNENIIFTLHLSYRVFNRLFITKHYFPGQF